MPYNRYRHGRNTSHLYNALYWLNYPLSDPAPNNQAHAPGNSW